MKLSEEQLFDLIQPMIATVSEKDITHHEVIACTRAIVEQVKVTENTSDGYHTFKELYLYRMLYNAGLFNEWAKQLKFDVHKSWRHSDGEECFGGGWFIVMATLPTGQISNHYEAKYWDLFKCDELLNAQEWDGHTPADVAVRLMQFLGGKNA